MDATGLENELLNDNTEALPFEEVTYNGDREYDAGENTGRYGYVEVEIDGELKQCTNAYMSNAYGGQYCVGDTYTDPNGGSQIISSINPSGLALSPAQWDAEETYAEAGEKMGMSLEEWTEFSAELQALNETVSGLQGGAALGPTEIHVDRVTGRIQQANPEWTPEQVQAEVNRVLETEFEASDAYKEAAAAETALFAKYGIRKENPGIYGSGIYVDGEGKYHKFESSSGNYYQTSQDTSFLDVAVPIGIGIGIGAISGGLGGALGTGSLGSVAGGALNSVIGSAIGQVGMTGSLDPSSLLQAAIIGGIGGLADAAVDGKLPKSLDTKVWEMADSLNLEYAELVDIIEGTATGAISGGDLESIVAGAAGSWTASQLEGWVRSEYGDTVDVDDWFKDGESHIPVDALNPIIEGTINAAINGGMSKEDALTMAFDYFKAGGDVDFMLPDAVSGAFSSWLDKFPGLDFEKGGWGVGYDEESNDWVINHDFPSFDFDWTGGGALPQLGNPCTTAEGQEGKIGAGALEGSFICEGFDIDLQIGAPCTDPEGNEGKFILGPDGNSAICNVELPDLPNIGAPCTDPEGNEGKFILGPDGNSAICNVELPDLPDIGAPCTDPAGNEGTYILGPDGNSAICNVELPELPDIGGPCTDPEGNEGTYILGPDGNSAICNVELPDVELPDIDIPNPCGEGSFLDEAGICQPEIGGGKTAQHNFQPQGLFDYSQIDVYKGTPLEPWKEELNTVRGMLS